ncbi:MAG: hypothetical protein OXH78_10750 [Acidimicrobiaceae bacterium]|nr:hypothetical protein [Acidimicrobiaceae bacterium]
MKSPTRTSRTRLRALDPRRSRADSHILLTICEGLAGLGAVSVLCAIAGSLDDAGDSVVLGLAGVLLITLGAVARVKLKRRRRPTTAAVLSGLAATWVALVVAATAVYLSSGAIGRADDALVEAAAGFSTTALTTLDPSELSVPMSLWRACTQWLGGLVGILIGVVALPMALQGQRLTPTEWSDDDATFARGRIARRRQVMAIYLGLTAAIGVAFAATGMGAEHSAVHALTTISTGGFSSMPDSFASFGAGPAAVATVGMIIAGSGYAIIWWAIRGRRSALTQSIELRIYGAILLFGTLLVWWCADGLSWNDSLFTTVSAASTTGFAVADWTALDDAVTALLLVIIATGSMIGSAGAGLGVSRARILVAFARRELRRQLDPGSVVVLKTGGQAVGDPAVERITGHQIAHFATCAGAAGLLASAGVDLLGAIYTGVSVVSTHGPGIGVGSFGSLENLSRPARLLLVPFMSAGRLSLVPLMIGIVWIVHAQQGLRRELRALWRVWPERLASFSLAARRALSGQGKK